MPDASQGLPRVPGFVERIWGDKLDRTATMEYAVTGTWSDPKVKETEDVRMTQPISVAAIQMTSGQQLSGNLEAASVLLEHAANGGATGGSA